MMKKALKITGIVLAVLLVALIAAPFVLEGQLKDFVKKAVNNNLNATVDFSDLDLSFFRSFPRATLVLSDVSVINKEPFAGDTLALSQEILLTMSVKELFKGSEQPKKIDVLKLNNAYVNIIVDSLGNANYDIALKDNPGVTTDTIDSPFSLDLQHYEITNSRLRYRDAGSKISLLLEELNHQGTGDFSLDQSELETNTSTLISLDYDGTNYLNRNKLGLDAVIQMDLEQMRYTFLENEATINQLPLTFDGFVQVNEEDTDLDISFKTPSSSFKNFLAVIPETYSKDIENVQTSGDFVVNGRLFGMVDDVHIPKMDIKISSDNASFKYPDLPKSVQDIQMKIAVVNETGLAEDTFVDIDNFRFRIDQDVFSGSGKLRNLTENMLVNLALQGTINLANLSRAYPVDLEQDLNGILTADVNTSFDMNSIEKEQYQNVKSSGTAGIRDFSYKSPEIPNELKIASASMNFREGNVQVPELKMTTGRTDITASGNIRNLMGYLFTDQQLKGTFTVSSETFAVNDFTVAEDTGEPAAANDTAPQAVKIPSFLDVQLDFNANRVLYDDLVLRNTKGRLLIKDETATLQNVSSSLFDGAIALNGSVSTKPKIPTFDMELNLSAMDIAKSFNGLELLQALAPVARALDGRFQTAINLNGNLNGDLTPLLNSLTGQAQAEILTAEVNPEQLPLLSRLDQQLQFINLDDIKLDNLKGRFSFNNGRVEVSPFDFNIKGVDVNVSGSHSFDNQMNYNLALEVPATMFGSEVGGTLARLSAQDLKQMTVQLPVGLSGTFQNPNISINTQQAVNRLAQQIISQQKQELTQRGKEALGDIITGRKPGDTAARVPEAGKDTIPKKQQEQVKDAAQTILKGILGGKKKARDTVKKNNQ